MPDSLTEAARFKARLGSFKFSPKLRSFIKKDAIVWTSLSRPGDDGFPVAVLVGPRGSRPRMFVNVPVRDAFKSEVADAEFFADVGRFLAPWLDPKMEGDWPQIVVGSRADVDHLQGIAIRAAGVGDLGREEKPTPEIYDARMFGLKFGYPTCGRYHAYGQQAVLAMTELLSRHIATGLSDAQREHVLCHWFASAIDTSQAGLANAKSLLLTQASHRPNPDSDEKLGKCLSENDVAFLTEFAHKHLSAIWKTISDGLSFLESSFPDRCGHLEYLGEEEAVKSGYFRKHVNGENFQFRDFRPRLRGFPPNDLVSTIEYMDAEASLQKMQTLEVLHDPVVRASMRLRDCRDFSWGTVIEVEGRKFKIELAATSSNPDPRKVLTWIGLEDPAGVQVFTDYREDVLTGKRTVLIGFRGEGRLPRIGDIVQLYEKERFSDVSTTKRVARLRIPQASVLRGTVLDSVGRPAPRLSGAAADLRSYRP